MESLELKTRVDENGMLRVSMPKEMAGKEIRVVLVYESLHRNHPHKTWPDNFFDDVAGSLPDFPDIEYEGDFEEREPIPVNFQESRDCVLKIGQKWFDSIEL